MHKNIDETMDMDTDEILRSLTDCLGTTQAPQSARKKYCNDEQIHTIFLLKHDKIGRKIILMTALTSRQA
jgi:hypothetical protein